MTDIPQPARDVAAALGTRAARADAGLTACPYDPAGDDRQRVLANVWVRAYLAESPAAVSFDD